MGQPTPLKSGQNAPVFQFFKDGKILSLEDITGPCLLYFYPKDDTPGCTKQACGLRDAWAEYQKAGIQVIGVSKDDEHSHEKFREKHSLPFPLIADTELELCQAYGVWGEKKFMGRVYDGIHRISFLIDANGRILKTYLKVKPEAHPAEVLSDLSELTDRPDQI